MPGQRHWDGCSSCLQRNALQPGLTNPPGLEPQPSPGWGSRRNCSGRSCPALSSFSPSRSGLVVGHCSPNTVQAGCGLGPPEQEGRNRREREELGAQSSREAGGSLILSWAHGGSENSVSHNSLPRVPWGGCRMHILRKRFPYCVLRHSRKFQVTMLHSLATEQSLRSTECSHSTAPHTEPLARRPPIPLTASNRGVLRAGPARRTWGLDAPATPVDIFAEDPISQALFSSQRAWCNSDRSHVPSAGTQDSGVPVRGTDLRQVEDQAGVARALSHGMWLHSALPTRACPSAPGAPGSPGEAPGGRETGPSAVSPGRAPLCLAWLKAAP